MPRRSSSTRSRVLALVVVVQGLFVVACYGTTGDESLTGTRTPTGAYVPVDAPEQNPTPPGAAPPPPGPDEPPPMPMPDAAPPPPDSGGQPPMDSGTG